MPFPSLTLSINLDERLKPLCVYYALSKGAPEYRQANIQNSAPFCQHTWSYQNSAEYNAKHTNSVSLLILGTRAGAQTVSYILHLSHWHAVADSDAVQPDSYVQQLQRWELQDVRSFG